jgi:hypothetical protein
VDAACGGGGEQVTRLCRVSSMGGPRLHPAYDPNRTISLPLPRPTLGTFISRSSGVAGTWINYIGIYRMHKPHGDRKLWYLKRKQKHRGRHEKQKRVRKDTATATRNQTLVVERKRNARDV